ncbi:Cyclic dehypoxanthine futalosine synthase [Streptomyces fumanus]
MHSLGASEVEHMARISKVSVEEAIQRIHAAGLDSFAGAGAELLPERRRKAIAPLKESGERWLEIMETAHNLGVESTSTMLMGTGETNAERIEPCGDPGRAGAHRRLPRLPSRAASCPRRTT